MTRNLQIFNVVYIKVVQIAQLLVILSMASDEPLSVLRTSLSSHKFMW